MYRTTSTNISYGTYESYGAYMVSHFQVHSRKITQTGSNEEYSSMQVTHYLDLIYITYQKSSKYLKRGVHKVFPFKFIQEKKLKQEAWSNMQHTVLTLQYNSLYFVRKYWTKSTKA